MDSVKLLVTMDGCYTAYTTGWESLMESASTHHALAGEAILLGRMLAQLMRREPEAHGFAFAHVAL
jgi:predicted RNA polymerase sigma factor